MEARPRSPRRRRRRAARPRISTAASSPASRTTSASTPVVGGEQVRPEPDRHDGRSRSAGPGDGALELGERPRLRERAGGPTDPDRRQPGERRRPPRSATVRSSCGRIVTVLAHPGHTQVRISALPSKAGAGRESAPGGKEIVWSARRAGVMETSPCAGPPGAGRTASSRRPRPGPGRRRPGGRGGPRSGRRRAARAPRRAASRVGARPGHRRRACPTRRPDRGSLAPGHFRDGDGVRRRERARQLVREMARARVAKRPEHDQHATVAGALARGRDRDGDLRGWCP